MKLVKCPRCELNYMREDESLCSVCRKELQGNEPDEPMDLCIECGEHPAVPNGELCVRCLRASVRAAKEAAALEDDDPIMDDDEVMDESELVEMEDLEIELLDDVDDEEIPEEERGEIERELGIDDDMDDDIDDDMDDELSEEFKSEEEEI